MQASHKSSPETHPPPAEGNTSHSTVQTVNLGHHRWEGGLAFPRSRAFPPTDSAPFPHCFLPGIWLVPGRGGVCTFLSCLWAVPVDPLGLIQPLSL